MGRKYQALTEYANSRSPVDICAIVVNELFGKPSRKFSIVNGIYDNDVLFHFLKKGSHSNS